MERHTHTTRLIARRAAVAEEKLIDYRRHVAKVAAGGELSAAEVDRLDDDLDALGIDPEGFNDDVERLRNHDLEAAWQAGVDCTIHENEARQTTAEIRQLKEQITALESRNQIANHAMLRFHERRGELAHK